MRRRRRGSGRRRRARPRRRPRSSSEPPVSSSSRSSVPFISPSSCRLRPVIISLSPIRRRPPRTGWPSGLSRSRSALVERVDPELAAVDRREHLDVADGIDARSGRGAARPRARRSPRARRAALAALDQEQVAAHLLGRREGRRLAAADRVRALDDHAPRRLAEDVGQPRRRHRARGDQLGERLAGADRGELIGVADEHHVRLGADRAQERDEQLEVRHRGLVDDQQVAAAAGRARRGSGPSPGIQPERRVDRGGAHPARLVHPDRRAAGRGDQQHARALTGGDRGDRPDRRGLAGPGTAGDQRQAVGERVVETLQLLGGEVVVLVASGAPGRPVEAVAGRPPRAARGRARPARPRARRSGSGRSSAARRGRGRRRRRARRSRLGRRWLSEQLVHGRAAAARAAGRCCRRARPRTGRAGRRRACAAGCRGRRRAAARSGRRSGSRRRTRWSARTGCSQTTRCAPSPYASRIRRGEIGQPVGGEQQVQAAGDAEPLPGVGSRRRSPRPAARPR